MSYTTILQTHVIGGNPGIELFVPDPVQLVQEYKAKDKSATSLYWARVWPSAIGLCIFLENNLHYLKNKKLLELAAGPGLPGIFAAAYASTVCISDVEPAAVELIQKSVAHNKIGNASYEVIDWNELANISTPDTVLLSDINYEPAQFAALLVAINYLLSKKCTIILSTPQRLMAKEFINELLLHCTEQTFFDVDMDNKKTAVSVFVLKTN